MLLLTLPLLAAGLAAAPAPSDDLREQIRQADAQLFAAAFDDCDADKAAAMTTEDMEFFHDKAGKSASKRDDFRRSVAALCESTRVNHTHLRRELVEARCRCSAARRSRPGDRRPPLPRARCKRCRALDRPGPFIQVWRRVDGRWLAERVISYDHRPAD